ncbi:MAG TPA: hypothetical protein VMQ17_13910 [Candidatus Sulfotelmatobacter sp.]|nr:hypothetical protein [Candidatus Sulfotelmatobacter sp.]
MADWHRNGVFPAKCGKSTGSGEVQGDAAPLPDGHGTTWIAHQAQHPQAGAHHLALRRLPD